MEALEGLFAYYSKLSTSVDPTDFGIVSFANRIQALGGAKNGANGPSYLIANILKTIHDRIP